MLFDIAPSEMLLTVIVAVVVIGPKDLPLALRTAGRWLGKMRRVSGHFRTGIETMIREAELEDMEKKWREQNATIMQAHPQAIAPALIEHAPPGDAPADAQLAVARSEDVPPESAMSDDAWDDATMSDHLARRSEAMAGHASVAFEQVAFPDEPPHVPDLEPQLPLHSAPADTPAAQPTD